MQRVEGSSREPRRCIGQCRPAKRNITTSVQRHICTAPGFEPVISGCALHYTRTFVANINPKSSDPTQ